jgi:imidazolonepropionase
MSPGKEESLFVGNCAQLLTMQGPGAPRTGKAMRDLAIIPRGAVLIRNGTVQAVDRESRLKRFVGARSRFVDANGGVVLPGFVDSHTHGLFPGPRLEEFAARIEGATYADIGQAGGGIHGSARRLQATSTAGLMRNLRRTVGLFLEHGTTTAEVKSGYGLEVNQELRMLRVIRAVARSGPCDLIPTLLIHAIPARFRARRTDYLKLITRKLIPAVGRMGLAEFCDVFCDRGYFSVQEARNLLEAAAQAGLRAKIHAEQLAHSGAAVMAMQLGATSVDHLEHLTEADIRRIRGARTVMTLLPGAVFHLGTAPYPPARRLIDAGAPVALATNYNPGSSPTANMQIILSTACSQMRMTPEEVLTAATINGAWAVGRGHLVGSLEPGKQADLAIMAVSDYREIPYFFGMNHCTAVIKKGRIIYSRDRQ